MTKLLNKPLKAFILYALCTLLVSIPVYYKVLDLIWLNEIDEYNELMIQRVKDHFRDNHLTSSKIEFTLENWHVIEPGVMIVPFDEEKAKERVYEVTKANPYEKEEETDRFRGMRSTFHIEGKMYLISVETNIEESDEILIPIALVTFVFFLIMITGFILLNRRISYHVWNPFYLTLDRLKDFSLSDKQEFKKVQTKTKEFEELNHVLDHLIQDSIHIYQQQKSFLENASHELQTPIAVLKSKLNLLMQESNVTKSIHEQLSKIEAPLSKLSRINKNLLLLAKVENFQFEETENISLGNVIQDSMELFEDYSASKSLKINFIEKDYLSINAHPFLMETLIYNLLSNSIKFSPEKDNIEILTEKNRLVISNKGLHPLDSSKVFQRFSRADTEKVGSGLGLAIVKEISVKYQWTVTYTFQEGKHYFTVQF